MKHAILSFVLLLFCTFVLAQNSLTPMVENLVEQIAESREEEDFSFLYENLLELAENKLNLNTATREQLQELYILNDEQIENLHYYLYRYGPMLSVYELGVIDGFDEQTIANLLLFAEVRSNTESNAFALKELLKNGKHELYSKTTRTFELKAGYKDNDDANPNKRYLGRPFGETVRYSFNAENRLLFGLTMDKDAGEKFTFDSDRRHGFDFYAPYLQINNLWKFNKIVAGHFRAAFGYGLVLNNNFSMGKSSYVLNVLPKSSGIGKSSSSNEYNYFNGAGCSFRAGQNLLISVFYSYKKNDATPISGSSSFSAIKTDGLHRTPLELGKKQLLGQQTAGANITLRKGIFKGGITSTTMLLKDSLNPKPNVYNQHYFRGKNQFHTSVDYTIGIHRWKFFGETAVAFHQLSAATLNGMLFAPVSRVRFIAIQRYYSPKYQAIFGNSFGENSSPTNESGFYVGAELLPLGHVRLSAYFDAFRFPWLKSGASMPTDGKDALVQAEYSPKRNLLMYLRYKYKENEKNAAIGKQTYLLPYDKHSCKYVLKYNIGENTSFQNTIEWNRTKNTENRSSTGFAIEQNISVKIPNTPFTADVHYVFFDAENYENRIYLYEKDVLYVFAVPMLYGRGSRACLNLAAKLKCGLSCAAKIAYTNYLNRQTIGSGLEEIDGSHKTDVTLMLRWKWK